MTQRGTTTQKETMAQRGTTTPLGPLQTTTLYAVVNADGTRVRGMGVNSSFRQDDGVYRITFSVDVSLGAFNVTPFYAGNGYRYANAKGDPGNPNAVIVRTAKPKDNDSVNMNSGFYLTVTTAFGDQDMMTPSPSQ